MSKNMNGKQPQVIISMTSFPAAIQYAEKAIVSLLKGSVLPDKLILYLTFSQFEGGRIPQELIDLQEKYPVFEIRNYDRDISSYRKLVPALNDFPDAIIVTVDDDMYYHRNMLKSLLNFHRKHPDAVVAHRVRRIMPEVAYRAWKKYRWYNFLTHRIYRSFLNLQTGVAGVLYPPGSLCKEMMDPDLFTQIAPTTDDIWFWAAAVANGYPVIPVPFGHNKPREIGKPKSISLKITNFRGDKDRNKEAFFAILNHYPEIKKRIGID